MFEKKHINKDNLSFLGLGKTLLKQNENAFHKACASSQLYCKGVYLYFDRNYGIFICSGKVTGRNFSTKHTEHKQLADVDTSSNFYR